MKRLISGLAVLATLNLLQIRLCMKGSWCDYISVSLPEFESRLDFEVREAQMVAMVAPACAHVRYACTPHSPRRGSIGRLRLVTARPA